MVRKLFLTPPDTPSENQCRSLEIPSSKEWLGIFNNAILQLANPWNYEQVNDTDLTPEEVAAACYDIYVAWLTSTCAAGTDIVDAPFWQDDSGDDADDEAPVADQTWYGSWDGETFLETVSYVFLTNFLSTLISPTAAIRFLTIPRAFRVAIRQSPHGANLLLFLDGGLFKVINGYSPFDKVAEFIIASPGTELMLVHDGTHDPAATPDDNGNYTVDVVRRRLSADDVVPPNIRYTGDPPILQTTTDGGTTWVDTPGTDPRYNPAALFPPLDHYSGIECDVAARMVAQMKDTLNTLIEGGDAAQMATEILAFIAFPFGWVGWILDLILYAINKWIDIGQANIEAAFTTAVYDDIQCTLSCYIDANGQISQNALDAAYDKIEADHPGTVANTIEVMRQLFTDVPMSNAGVSRDDTGDCSGCDSCTWFVEYDFTEGSPHSWQIYTDSTYGSYGSYNGTQFGGQRLPPWELLMFLLIPGCSITGYSFYGEYFHGTGLGNHFYVQDITSTSNPPTFTNQASGAMANDSLGWHQAGITFTTTEGIGFYWICDNNNTGYIHTLKIRLEGTGTPPAGGKRVNGLS